MAGNLVHSRYSSCLAQMKPWFDPQRNINLAWCMPLTPVLWRWKEKDQKFKVILRVKRPAGLYETLFNTNKQTNKETGRFHLANVRAAVKTSDNKCWWVWRKHNHYVLLVKSINSCSYSENQCGNFQKTKDRNCYDPAITLLGIYPQASMLYYWETCTSMFTAAVFTTAKRYDQLDVYQHERLMKMWYIYTTQQRRKIQLRNLRKWMEVEIL